MPLGFSCATAVAKGMPYYPSPPLTRSPSISLSINITLRSQHCRLSIGTGPAVVYREYRYPSETGHFLMTTAVRMAMFGGGLGSFVRSIHKMGTLVGARWVPWSEPESRWWPASSAATVNGCSLQRPDTTSTPNADTAAMTRCSLAKPNARTGSIWSASPRPTTFTCRPRWPRSWPVSESCPTGAGNQRNRGAISRNGR